MDATALIASALRGSASAATKALSRYRPIGVPRTGSPEDRAGAYFHFLDTTTRRVRATMRIHDIVLSDALDGAPMGASTVALDLHNRWSNAEDEFLSAIMAVRLCGTSYVTEAADNLFSILQNMQASNHDEDKYEDAYQAALKEFPKALNAFLEAARHDLAYNPKWWQLPRRWRERQYRKGRASAEAPALSA